MSTPHPSFKQVGDHNWVWSAAPYEGAPYCDVCEGYPGGSHYHCAGCNGVSSYQGHYTTGSWKGGRHAGQQVDWHFCCPTGCELET